MLVNSVVQSINEKIVDDLTTNLGYDRDTAVKMVEEYEGITFDLSDEVDSSNPFWPTIKKRLGEKFSSSLFFYF